MAPKYLGLDTNSTGSSFISSSRLNAVRQDSLVCNFMRFVYTLCFGIISVDACHVHLSGRKTHKKVQQNAFLMRQNKTECRFSRESSSGSHEHYKIKQITYLLPVGFFQLRVRLSVYLRVCVSVYPGMSLTFLYASTSGFTYNLIPTPGRFSHAF